MSEKKGGRARARLDRELQTVKEDVLRLGELVDSAIGGSLQALAGHDLDQARQLVRDDAAINRLRFEIEEACLGLMATQQPAAGDLRSVVAAMSVVVDLERMGDHAAGIGRTVLRMDGPPPDAPLAEMQRMAEVCRDMLRAGLRAFLARNAEAARSVAGRDEEIDQRYQKIFRGLIQSMVDDPKTTSAALYLLFTAHNLERIGDGITNIAERVIFMTSGVMRELNPDPPPPQRL